MDQAIVTTLAELRDARQREQMDGDHLAAQAQELHVRAEDRFADAGAYLVPRRAWWRVPADLVPWLAEADELVARIGALDRLLARTPETDRREAGWRPWARVRSDAARRSRDRAASRLRTALVTIARAGAPAAADVPDVRPILEEAGELQARAQHLRFALASRVRRLTDLDHEIERHEQAERLMGFDSLHLAAGFARYGLPEIESPYGLEAGEEAHLATEASLAQLPPGSRYPTGGSGVVPSPAHTGIPQWMGTLRDRPAPHGAERGQDRGVLLLTSRRLAFAGGGESVAVWLDAVIDMDVYRDAVAVLHPGPRSPLVLRLAAPRQVAFYLNWALWRCRSRPSRHTMP